MSIDLTLIPKKLPMPKTLKIWAWGIILLLYFVMGAGTTFIIDYLYHLTDVGFWAGITVIPFIGWLLTVCYGMYLEGSREFYVKSWNAHCDARRQQIIEFAQRPLHVLSSVLYTQHGKVGNASAITNQSISIQAQVPHSGGEPVPHSVLPLPDETAASNFDARLNTILKEMYSEWFSALSKIDDAPLHVRLFLDIPLNKEQMLTAWQNTFGKKRHYATIEAVDVKKSDTFLSDWLDNSDNDDNQLLVIGIHLFDVPKENSAETATSFLFLGHNLLENKTVAKSIMEDNPSLATVFRTEQKDDVEEALNYAMLWSAVNNKLDTVWYSNISPELNVNIMTYFNREHIEVANTYHIDAALGNANHCAYWTGLALACESALETETKQLIICGEPALSAYTVANYQTTNNKK